MRLIRNSIYSFSAQLMPLLVALVTIPLYLSEIGLERYGGLSIAWLLMGYFGTADFGLGRAITRRIASMPESSAAQRAGAVWSALTGMLGLSLITGGLVWLSAHLYFGGPFRIGEDLRAELLGASWILALAIPLMAINGVAAGALMGMERFRLSSASQMISGSGMQIFPLMTAMLVSHDLRLLIASALAAHALSLLPSVWGCWRLLLRHQPFSFSAAEFGQLTRFGAWVMVSALVAPLMIYADRLVIGAAMNATAVAAYAIAFQLTFRMLIFPRSLVNALFPRLASTTHDESQRLNRDFSIFVGQAFAIPVIALIAAFAPFLSLWLGEQLDPRSIAIGLILLPGIWLTAITIIPHSHVQARGDSRYTALVHLLQLPPYLGLLWWLGSQYGLSGVAAAFSLRCLAEQIVFYKKTQLTDRTVFLGLSVPALLILLAVLVGSQVQQWETVLGAGGLLALIAAAFAIVAMPKSIRTALLASPLGRYLQPILR